MAKLSKVLKCISLPENFHVVRTLLSYYWEYKETLGGIQQLRGQEEGEGGSAKSPRLSTKGGSLCVQMYFMRTFETTAKCNNINQV